MSWCLLQSVGALEVRRLRFRGEGFTADRFGDFGPCIFFPRQKRIGQTRTNLSMALDTTRKTCRGSMGYGVTRFRDDANCQASRGQYVVSGTTQRNTVGLRVPWPLLRCISSVSTEICHVASSSAVTTLSRDDPDPPNISSVSADTHCATETRCAASAAQEWAVRNATQQLNKRHVENATPFFENAGEPSCRKIVLRFGLVALPSWDRLTLRPSDSATLLFTKALGTNVI